MSLFADNLLDPSELALFGALHDLKKLHFVGNKELLHAPLKVAIIGTRRPMVYTRDMCMILASALCKIGAVIVSGGALGVDIIAQGAHPKSSIVILPVGLNHIYPRQNTRELKRIKELGLALSEYDDDASHPMRHTFLERNRLIVALADIIIVPEAARRSGSANSIALALDMGKEICTIPHRLGDSMGTNLRVADKEIEPIYDVDAFVGALSRRFNTMGKNLDVPPSEKEACDARAALLLEARDGLLLSQALKRYGDLVYELEIEGALYRSELRVIAT